MSKNMAIQPKDSFERFGDDLTEVLLGYLEFDDKFKYESISRQWKRLVYNNVYDVEVVEKVNNSFDLSKWQTIFRKCRNVTRVLLNIYYEKKEEFNDHHLAMSEDDETTDDENSFDSNDSEEEEDEINEDNGNNNNIIIITSLNIYKLVKQAITKTVDIITTGAVIIKVFVFRLISNNIDNNGNDDEVDDDVDNMDNESTDESVSSYNGFDKIDLIYNQLSELIVNECRHITEILWMSYSSSDLMNETVGRAGRQYTRTPFQWIELSCQQIKETVTLRPYYQLSNERIIIDDIVSSTSDDNLNPIIDKQNNDSDNQLNTIDSKNTTDSCYRKQQSPKLWLKLKLEQKVVDKVIDSQTSFESLTNLLIVFDGQHASRQQFQQLVNKCPKLRRFTYNFKNMYSTAEHMIMIADINEAFGGTQVTQLIISGFVFIYCHLTSDLFNKCRQLRLLSICCARIRDPFFVDLAINLPNLRNLRLIEVELTDLSLESLAKLQRLATLTVQLRSKSTYSETGLMNLKTRQKFRRYLV